MRKIFQVTVCTLLLVSCKKNQLDGNSSVHGTVAHHDKPIANATVFIKFDATEFPGEDTLLYDAKVRADINGAFSFSCYKGHYYLFGFGYDYDIPAPHIVKGGTGVKVKYHKKTTITLGVTED